MLLLRVLLCFILFKHCYTQGIPIPLLDRAESSASGSKSPFQPRSLWDIVLSCFSTILLCSWSSVHFNIPPPGKVRPILLRLSLMLLTIIAPELILAWAVRQWFAARAVRDIYNKNRKSAQTWTMTHGHFLVMGGFILIDPPTHRANAGIHVLSFEQFLQVICDPAFEFPPITEDEINDKSKGDILSKAIAIVHTTWFIIQCIARKAHGLEITELELSTVALASLNAVTYGAWWYKPIGVLEPVKIYLSVPNEPISPRITPIIIPNLLQGEKQDIPDIPVKHFLSSVNRLLRKTAAVMLQNPCRRDGLAVAEYFLTVLLFCLPFFITFPVFFPVQILLVLVLNKFKPRRPPPVVQNASFFYHMLEAGRNQPCTFTDMTQHLVRRLLDAIWGPIWDMESSVESLGYWFAFVVMTPFLGGIVMVNWLLQSIVFGSLWFSFHTIFTIVTSSTVQPFSTRVPLFYAPITKSDRYSRMVMFASFGAVFGAIHCLAWNFTFPTQPERDLWRVTSLLITVIPVIAAPIDFITSWANSDNLPHSLDNLGLVFVVFFLNLLYCAYIPIRLSLIAQALALLRSQPPSVFLAVDWTRYIPHAS